MSFGTFQGLDTRPTLFWGESMAVNTPVAQILQYSFQMPIKFQNLSWFSWWYFEIPIFWDCNIFIKKRWDYYSNQKNLDYTSTKKLPMWVTIPLHWSRYPFVNVEDGWWGWSDEIKSRFRFHDTNITLHSTKNVAGRSYLEFTSLIATRRSMVLYLVFIVIYSWFSKSAKKGI
jgi:hypothetical protein